jgi:hypothetical protein
MADVIETDSGEKKIEVRHTDEQVAKVEQWLKENRKEGIAVDKPVKPVEIPPDIVEDKNNQEAVMQEAFPKDVEIGITDEDKTLYMKAVLTGNPVILRIKLFGEAVTMEFRSRTSYEHERILAIAREDVKDKLIEDGDLAAVLTKIQQYAILIQLKSFNGTSLWEHELKPGNDLAKDKMDMRLAFVKNIAPMQQTRYLALWQGIQDFERKCNKLSRNAINTDFWKAPTQN